MAQEAQRIPAIAMRVARCEFFICLFVFCCFFVKCSSTKQCHFPFLPGIIETHDKWFEPLKWAIELTRCMKNRMWDNSPHVLRQIENLGNAKVTSLANAGIVTFADVRSTEPRMLEMVGFPLIISFGEITEFVFGLDMQQKSSIWKPDQGSGGSHPKGHH